MDIAMLVLALTATLLFLGRLAAHARGTVSAPDSLGIALFFATIASWVLFYVLVK